MIIYIFYAIHILLLLFSILIFHFPEPNRKFSISLILVLFALPVLCIEYLYFYYNFQDNLLTLILFSENIFAFFWFISAYWLQRTISVDGKAYRFPFISVGLGIIILAISAYCLIYAPVALPRGGKVIFSRYGIYFFNCVLLLIAMVNMAWRLENFWRGLSPSQRWMYKFFAVGSYLICATLGWSLSYRLTYSEEAANHFQLLPMLLILGWILMVYSTTRHRLLNRKIFVSRKIVYTAIAPLAFGIYLIVLGFVILIMQTFGLSLPFVLQWLLVVGGLVVIASMAVSGKVRHRIKFFISTNFYNNKYEYRDEWLAFSWLLKGALTESEIVEALHRVLSRSLYTTMVYIWCGDDVRGYRLTFPKEVPEDKPKNVYFSQDDPLILYLKDHHHFYIMDKPENSKAKNLIQEKQAFCSEHNLVLFSPLSVGDHLIGLIGLAPEFTGGRYGHDDFDLLIALGTQAASALLAATMAEKLAQSRQQEAWNTMSAFILHDLKNASSMLSLVRQNAPIHLDNPEFQQDMLETIDHSLRRMNKINARLSALKGEIVPVWQEVELCKTLTEVSRTLTRRLQGLHINCNCEQSMLLKTDPEILTIILENLLLNALESGGTGTSVNVKAKYDGNNHAIIEINDTGPGFPAELLPDAMFEPFKTTKPKGTGIGLWQVRQLVVSLGGRVTAGNAKNGGAQFLITLPILEN